MSDRIYLRFMGGLGNQMFQFALLESLRSKGREVYPNLQWYEQNQNASLELALTKVFKNVELPVPNEKEMKKSRKIQRIHKGINLICRKEVFYVGEREDAVFEPDIFDRTKGTWDGYWQSEKYFLPIEEKIRKEFSFTIDNPSLQKMIDHMEQTPDTVSVHLRRGDYKGVEDMYGGICTPEYYKRAIEYMKEKLGNPTFYIFSNDMPWVKENFKGENFVYITEDLFDGYENWYDMCLMSHCKNNIIANSSFSWWGAWLNQHEEKIVVAPKKWVNTSPTPDKWAKDWVKK